MFLLHHSQGQLTDASSSAYAPKFYDYRRLRTFEGTSQYDGQFYTYDARGNLLAHYRSPAGTYEMYAYADGIDEAVLMNSTTGSYPYGNGLYALVRDHLGSVVAIADNTGRLVETYDYTPFGKTTISDRYGATISTSDAGNILGFTSREMDGGLYYYRNRWYSPQLGRFLEPDPIKLRAADMNLYRYVQNNPVLRIDRQGLYWVSPPGCPLDGVTLISDGNTPPITVVSLMPATPTYPWPGPAVSALAGC
jgi:RHS repeat-associated protein